MFNVWLYGLIICGILWFMASAVAGLANIDYWDTRDEWETYGACVLIGALVALANVFLLPFIIVGVVGYGVYGAQRQIRKGLKEREVAALR